MKNSNSKVIAVIALVLAVVGLSIGFAALQTQLTINGTAEVTGGSKWDVKFVTGSLNKVETGSATGTDPTVAATSITGLKATLLKPGDKVTYYFQVTNAGSFDAKIDSITIGTPTCSTAAFCSNLKYTFAYTTASGGAAGTAPAAGDTLAVNETKWLVLSVEYLASSDASTLPKDTVTVDGLTATINYVQK